MGGDEIAGVSLCRSSLPEDPLLGRVDELAVRRPWRRQGIALALLHHTFAEFKRRGMERVGLGVDTSSLTGAYRLFEKAGMDRFQTFNTYEKILRPGRDLGKRSLSS
jgi:ribosomal protein S18 acetylase RimI-like enzyme